MHQPASRLTYVAPVLQVADLDRSLAFYRDQLGFNLEFAYEGFYASVARDGCRVHLNRFAPFERDQRAFEAAEHLDACFGVEDAEALANAFASSGAVFSVELRSMPYGKEFYVRDPDGYILGFIQPGDTPRTRGRLTLVRADAPKHAAQHDVGRTRNNTVSTEITIRAAGAGDASILASLCALVQELHFHGRPDVFKRADVDGLTQWFTDTLAAGTAKTWIAEIGGGPAGYALVVEHRRPENVFCYARRWHEVEQIGVHPRFRSLGVGRELLDHIVRVAAENDVREVELNTWIFNTSAHHAFQRCGFATKNLRFERSARQM